MGKFLKAILFLTVLVSVEARTRKQFDRSAQNDTSLAQDRFFATQESSNNESPTCIIVRNRRSVQDEVPAPVTKDAYEVTFRQLPTRKRRYIAAPVPSGEDDDEEAAFRLATSTSPPPALPTYLSPPAPPSPPVNCIITTRPNPPSAWYKGRRLSEAATPIRSGRVLQRRKKKSHDTRRKYLKRFTAQKPDGSKP